MRTKNDPTRVAYDPEKNKVSGNALFQAQYRRDREKGKTNPIFAAEFGERSEWLYFGRRPASVVITNRKAETWGSVCILGQRRRAQMVDVMLEHLGGEPVWFVQLPWESYPAPLPLETPADAILWKEQGFGEFAKAKGLAKQWGWNGLHAVEAVWACQDAFLAMLKGEVYPCRQALPKSMQDKLARVSFPPSPPAAPRMSSEFERMKADLAALQARMDRMR